MLSVNMDRERIYRILTVRFPCGIGGKLISKIDLETKEITAEYSVGTWDQSGSLVSRNRYQLKFPENQWSGAQRVLLDWAEALKEAIQQDYEVDELDLSGCESIETQLELMRMAGHNVWQPEPSQKDAC